MVNDQKRIESRDVLKQKSTRFLFYKNTSLRIQVTNNKSIRAIKK